MAGLGGRIAGGFDGDKLQVFLHFCDDTVNGNGARLVVFSTCSGIDTNKASDTNLSTAYLFSAFNCISDTAASFSSDHATTSASDL